MITIKTVDIQPTELKPVVSIHWLNAFRPVDCLYSAVADCIGSFVCTTMYSLRRIGIVLEGEYCPRRLHYPEDIWSERDHENPGHRIIQMDDDWLETLHTKSWTTLHDELIMRGKRIIGVVYRDAEYRANDIALYYNVPAIDLADYPGIVDNDGWINRASLLDIIRSNDNLFDDEMYYSQGRRS